MNIQIIDDNVLEPDETFSLEIIVPEAAVRAGIIEGCDPVVTIEIINDDGKLIVHHYCNLRSYQFFQRFKFGLVQQIMLCLLY